MPCLLLPIVSVVEPLVVKPSLRWALVVAAVIVLLSFLTQFIGVSIGPNTASFETMLLRDFFAWSNTPFAYVALLAKTNPDLAWLHLDGGPLSLLGVVVPALGVVLLGAALLWWGVSRPQATSALLATAMVSLVVLLGVSLWSLHWYYRHDTRYQAPEGFTSAIQLVTTQAQPGDILLYEHWKTRPIVHVYASMVSNACGYDCPPSIEVFREDIHYDRSFLDKIRGTTDRVWLVPGNLLVHESEHRNTAVAGHVSVQGGLPTDGPEMKLCLYFNLSPSDELSPAIETPHVVRALDRATLRVHLPLVVSATSPKRNPQTVGPSKRRTELDAYFGDTIRLNTLLLYWRASGVQEPGEPVVTQPGQPLLIELLWQAVAPMDTRYKVSLQLLDSSGQLVHRMDREPLDGFWPTSSWQQSQLFSDRLAFVLPATLAAGNYQLKSCRVRSTNRRSTPVGSGDSVKLTDLTVVSSALTCYHGRFLADRRQTIACP